MNKRFQILKLASLLLSIVIFEGNLHAEDWVYAGTVTDPGVRPSICVVDYYTAWIGDGSSGNPKVFRTVDGENWTSIPTTGMDKEVYCIWAISSVTAFAGEGEVSGNARLFRTNDAGQTWVSVGQSGPNQGFFNGIIFSRKLSQYGFALAERIFKTTDNGQSWVQLQSGLNGVSNAHNSLFMVDNSFFGFGMNNGAARLRESTDGGSSWNNQTLNISGSYTCAVAFHNNHLYGVAATSTSLPNIARTADGGNTWSSVNVGTGATGECKLKWVAGSSVVYLMGEDGTIKRSLDNALTWSTMQTPNVTQLYHFDFIKINDIIYGYAVSKTGTVIKLADSVLFLTGIGRNNSGVPSNYALYQNYPNPFNPVTVIGFDMPNRSYAKLVIYDALGREVETLVNEQLETGYHEFTWDAAVHASGIYYYTLNTGSFKESKKMILAK